MGQQVSLPAAVTQPPGERAQLRPLQAPYVPLCDVLKAGDAGVAASAGAEDAKDAMDKILEFGAAMSQLPKESEVMGRLQARSPEQQMKEIMSSVDSVDELFQHISQLAGLPTQDGLDPARSDGKRDAAETMPGVFDARIASYIKNLQTLYQMTKKEKYRHEQRLLAARAHAMSLRKVSPPPLPLPTQNCMTMGWDLVVMLLKATRKNNPEQYEQALRMVKENLKPLKPTAYSDSMYLAPSASSAFNLLNDCLAELSYPVDGGTLEGEARVGARTIETLAEVGLARGSLATMLFVVLWLMKQPPTSVVNLEASIAKLAALKEQPMYGKCEASGELYSCGQNSYGELGTGDDIERHQLTSVALCGWDDIRQVVSGNETLAILTNDGVVLTCGLNKSGQCGQGHFDERVMMLRPVQALRSQRVKFIAASNGCEHMIAVTDTGLAYSWGYNDRGQLGHENLSTKIHVPKLIESMKDKKLVFASVSYHHSAVITDAGELYTFGMNDCGQLGLDHTQHQSTPQLVKSLEGTEVSMVACGLYHTIICTAAGELFSCGKNDYGQLGLAHNRQVKVPTLVGLPNEMVCFVACGYYHTVVVTTGGRTFSFGRNDYGQLGIGNKIHQNVPNVVALSANTRMVRSTCGCYHTVLLSEQGSVFVFGRNNKGQLGNRGSADALLPVPLKVRPEKNSRRCVDVAAGFYTTSLIMERKRENDDAESVLQDHSCVVPVCGRVDIDRSGEIEGLSNFGSISTVGVSLFRGKWFYEVEVVTSGLIQVGWIDGYFQGSSDQGEGVGDHAHSWSYDGNRQRRWNSGSSSYGEKWKAGDIIGCLLDLNTQEMTFFRNGVNLGVAYSEVKCSLDDKRSGMMPGISLERGEIIRINLGHQPFAYPPAIGHEFESISRAVMIPSSSAVIQPPEAAPAIAAPPPLEGSASLLVGTRLFIVGGLVVNDASLPQQTEPTNQVWVYDTETKSWEKWSDFPIGIRNHQLVSIDDNQILAIGGENNCPASRHMDLYKCATTKNADGTLPTWTLIQAAIGAATSMPQARAFHTASTIRVRLDSIVFMFGGQSVDNEILGDAWYLSLDDYAWSRLPSSVSLDPGARIGCSSTVIGECVYIFGGQDREEKFRSDLWRYNTFDRLWHLCHDDNIGVLKDGAANIRGDSQSAVPEGRINYSLCSDLGNIWMFGGTTRIGDQFCDLWCFSVLAQKWNRIEVNAQGALDGCCSASLHIQSGVVTALSSAPDYESPTQQNGDLLLVGGQINIQGKVSSDSHVRKISTVSSSGAYNLDMTKGISATGKAGHVLSSLRTKFGSSSRGGQNCVPDALDSAICLLSHLDRLAGNDIPGDDVDSVQLSRCPYRSLCIDPKESTFSALYSLLESIATKFFEANLDESASTSPLVTHLLYPLLVTIRLLKLNFFEFSRSCLDGEEIGLPDAASQPGGILHSIRETLFSIADHVPKRSMSGEALWFYHAVKQETASAIYYGFATLFPSLLDRLQVMNRLMANQSQVEFEVTPARKLLIPMLVPCFTSAKTLFQLMKDPVVLFKVDGSSETNVAETVIIFISTLLDTLREQTHEALQRCSGDPASLIKSLDAVESSHEFKCLNVMLRAAIFWCSCSAKQSWVIIEAICTKLVAFISEHLNQSDSVKLEQSHLVPILIQRSFGGRLLPFVLLSVFSLPSVRNELPALLNKFWCQLDDLSVSLHAAFAILSKRGVLQPSEESREVSSTPKAASDADFVDDARASVSKELSTCLLQQSCGSSVTYGHIFKRLWDKIIHSKGFTSWKVRDLPLDAEIRRVIIPADLSKLLGTETLLVKVQKTTTELVAQEYDPEKITFAPSRTILSQHIYPVVEIGLPTPGSLEIATIPPPVPQLLTRVPPPAVRCNDKTLEESHEWLRDLQRVLAWVGSHYAATLIIGGESDDGAAVSERWLHSPLFRGGLEEARPSSVLDDSEGSRNETLLQQVMDNVGNGKKLLDKVRNALDPGSAPGSANPQLRVARLKRQDSVEATLEKSGGIEAVDRAVRATFAALLKHTNISYTTEPISNDGALAETVIDAWKAALQLRRWIVREQQKMAAVFSEAGAPNGFSPEMDARERQQVLYNAVCEPVIRRAQLLLQLAPAPIQCSPSASSPMKLLPGISIAPTYDFGKAAQIEPAETARDEPEQKRFTRQLNKLMETKSKEAMEEEDEQVHADIFAFIQQSSSNLLTASRSDDTPDRYPEDQMRDILLAHQNRATRRLQGLKTFVRLLQCTDNIPSSRFHVIPMLSSAFKRVCENGGQTSENASARQASTVKVHFLIDLEFAGPQLSDAIAQEFFYVLTLLLKSSTEHLRQVQQLIEAGASGGMGDVKSFSSTVQAAVQDMLLVLETCCFPYKGQDWNHLQRTNLVSLLTDLTSWKGWQSFIQFDAADSSPADVDTSDKYAILPAATGSKYPNIICSRYITLGTDLRKLTITHKTLDDSDESAPSPASVQEGGGLAVFDKAFYRGRWYWEVSVRALEDTPVFVGVTPGTADLNTFVPHEGGLCGVFLYREGCSTDMLPGGIRWNCTDVLGVMLNCEGREIEFYIGAKRCFTATLALNGMAGCDYYPSIGIKDADVHWNLAPSIPPKLWCRSSNFQFPNAVVSGGLVAAPFDGATISWNGKLKGSHLQLMSNGTIVAAGDCITSEDQFETIVASQGFNNESIFVEIRIVAAGKDGRAALSFGMVGSEFSDWDTPLKHKLDTKWKSVEEVLEWGIFGVLFDFENATITLFSDRSEPEVCHLSLATLTKPLFPAVSALCNGTVFDVNFHPRPRQEMPSHVFYPSAKLPSYQVSSSSELQLGKSLQLQVFSCDGGEFSSSHAVHNCLLDDTSVYSSAKGANVNLVLKHDVDTPMCVSYMNFRGPGPGYSSPLRCALVFVTSTPPDLAAFQDFDSMTAEEFVSLPFPPSNGLCPRDENVPVAFFILDGSCAQISKQLAYPVTGRYILVKAICPSSGTNIDIGYMGFCGIFDRDNGPAYCETTTGSYSCEECRAMPLAGVYYGQRDDDSVKLCAACYDDNRGDLDSAYFVYTASEAQDDQSDANTLLCQPRRAWTTKISALSEVLRLPGAPGVDGTAGMATAKAPDAPSLVAFDDCELFSCGQNNYGELCLGHCNSTSKLEHVPFFSAKSVRDISGGNEVLAVVMKDGAVFTCGLNKSGQCGNGTFEERVIIATPVRALSGIAINMVAAANGCEHMLAVAADGAVYSWGYNDRGQLGIGSTISKSHTPRMIDSVREKYHITTAAVSYHHSAVVSSNGELLMFGMNDCGQLGLDHMQHQHTPQLVDSLSSHVVTKVACGLYHTVAITSGGEVYSFGKNDYGQLGLGHARNMKIPTLAKTSAGESDEKIVAVSCGYYHTVTISEKGRLITWGRNDYGQLGIGSKDHKNTAQYVPLPLSSKIKNASCGCYHTLILMSNGRVMVFGRNNKGQLGAGVRTLPSADLPLPVPSNSIANDEVVRIAAGFYSSYILTGRSGESRGPDGVPDDASQAKDLPENSCFVNSDALFESLMKEIDSKYATDSSVKRTALPVKRGYPQRKLPLVKLHAAGWAMARALVYRSLQDADEKSKNRWEASTGRVNPVLFTFINFLLENLKALQADPAMNNETTTAATYQLATSVSLKRVCVGMLQCFGSKFTGTSPIPVTVSAAPSDALHAHFYRNQILSVLLSCGSANSDVGAIIASNTVVTTHIISGMNSSDLASATMCIRLAMLIFPQHSVSALNKMYRSLQPTSTLSGDILNMLMTLVGLPLLLRPRLCSHELGIECSSTALCQSARCLKGVTLTKDSGVSHIQQAVLEKAHVAEAKAAEAVALLRYLTLYPTWKIAINAALTRGFAKATKTDELLDTICAYYTNIQDVGDLTLQTAAFDRLVSEDNDSTALRKPESTTSSPETDESINNTAESNTPAGDTEDQSNTRDKQSLMLWQKAKDALDGLATIFASVSIVGGHVESFREGSTVTIEGDAVQGSTKMGVLSGITRDPRTADLLAQVVISSSADKLTSPLIEPGSRAQLIPITKLQVVERMPALLDMFDDVESIITTLSSMISPAGEESSVHCDLNLPQNSPVQEVLGSRLRMYTQQIRWRSSKALSSLLKQIPTLSPGLTSMDSQLMSSLAALLSSERSLSWSSKSELPALEAASTLQKRWLCVKQRQIFLDTEEVIDSAVDHYESEMCDEVVQKLGSENALSWGMDAIQSPRRKVSRPSFPSAAPTGFGSSGSRGTGQRPDRSGEGDLPFGAWGVLLPLPPLNETEHAHIIGGPGHSAIDYTPFPLIAPITRVGRAAEACDLIVNDRSVSGRHFHLRRLRRETDGGEEQFELQDFSKNGTIVNGVRIHGSSTRITTGSRISLILSRGGLVTYEFQVRTPSGGIGGRHAPPPIITAPQNPGDLNILIPGQEYQQPQIGTPQIIPRSPAELQNRGSRGNAPDSNRQTVTQGLRVITSVAESDVPRALISPNPAVDSPRAGGFTSPRSSVLQAPGTPAVGSPTASMYPNMIPAVILSPASYQQRESFGPNEPPTVTSPRSQEGGVGSMLRIALGRDSVNRESTSQRPTILNELGKTRVLRSSGEVGTATRSNAPPSLQEMQVLMLRLLGRVQEANVVASAIECEEALRTTNGSLDDAFSMIQRSRGVDLCNYPSNVRQLAMVLGRTEAVCAEALRQTDNSYGDALRLLISNRGAELESSVTSPRCLANNDAALTSGMGTQTAEPLVNFQDIGDENLSYALTESSALRPSAPQRTAARTMGSPVKTKKMDNTGCVGVDALHTKSDLTLWSECNSSFDDTVRQMNAFEIELEEETLCDRLAVIHARKILVQIVRLFGKSSQNGDAALSDLGSPLVLRRLISLLNLPDQMTNTTCEPEYQLHQQPKAEKSGKIQQILSRMTREVMARSSAQTLTENLSSSRNLSSLQRSIDQVAENPTSVGWSGVSRLVEVLVESEDNRNGAGEDVNDVYLPSTLENVTFETILHILSRTHASPTATVAWESSPLRARKADGCFPKGPVLLSCGIEVMVIDTYERLWSIPPPDPLLKHRHKWRKRFSSSGSIDGGWMKSAADHAVTIWRPMLPVVPESPTSIAKKWFCLGDVVKCGNGAPDAPMLLFSDNDDQDLLMPPVSFERVDITGKGLPKNSESDPDFQRKQLRSIWWPVAPSGYVALGCVAGSKEDPFEPPDVSCTRCVREDLVKRVDAFHCVWRAASPASTGGGGVELPTTEEVDTETQDESSLGGENENFGKGQSTKNQAIDQSRMQLFLPVADDVVVQTSLWAVESDFCSGLLLPVVTLDDASAGEPSTAFAISLTDEDLVLCAPVTVDNVLAFVEVLLQCQQLTSSKQLDKLNGSAQLGPELPAALFSLVQQVLRENQPSSGQAAVSLVRALISVIQRGAHWHDKQALLYCRSKIMALSQDQDGGFTLHALLQAFVELMLAVEDQQRGERVQELAACLDPDGGGSLSLPYRFHFAKQPFVEMLVSHSSKMAVTRHLSGEERKFLLDYQADDSSTAAAREALAAEGLGAPPGEVYSCRFEHTPALVMTMRDEVKAEIVYFEVNVVEWSTSSSMGGSLALGFSPPSFPLEGVMVGGSADGARSYSFAPANGQVLCAGDTIVDRWRWVEPAGAVSPGDVFGCGLRLDTQEIFFCKNGQLLGTAFSSISRPQQLHPTISFNADCKLLANMGATATASAKNANFSFRFHSLDCDNLMSAFEWFEPLSQVYGVMKALMDPTRPDDVSTGDVTVTEAAAQLPDEFMLSADNFLSDISEDVCIRVESTHPYDLELQESLVSIPLATSIRVRLDPQSETASSHCLQILQGGSPVGSEGGVEGTTSGGGEAEVRAFTGACGGQEVTIEGDSFVWRFPVQSNFQCRVDRVRKGPYLKLEARDTRLSLVRDKGWQTAIGVARFDGGVHIWEVRITFVTASSNIFLGIARRDVRLDSYLGKDNRGWGWIGNRALWHNGSKQRGTYGDKFKTGDIVRLTLDLRRGTLSYALNGKDLGVAFGPGGTGPKLEGTFYPGFALYNQRDSIDLIGGHRVEDGGLEPGLPRTGSGLASGEDSYYSEEEEDTLGGFVGEGGLGDGAIPNFRMELGIALSQMGFPMEWCVYALRHCEDDAEQAADFILANMHAMEALVREEADAVARRARHRQLLQDQALTLSEHLEGEELDSTTLPPPPPIDGDIDALRSPEEVTTGEVSSLLQEQQQSSSGETKWGVAFTAVPEFSVTGRRLLATKYGEKLQRLHASQRVFTPARDRALVQLVNDICETRAEALLSCDPLRMTPEEFAPTEEQLHGFPVLLGIPLEALQRRFLVLRNFNCRLQTSLAFIDFSAQDERSLLARGVRALRGVVFQHVKLAWWLGVLKEQQAPAAARPEIEVDRHRAHDALELSERGDPLASEAGERDSVFAQTFEQLHGLQPALLRGADRAFKCQFVGEFGDDFGGLYRECLAQLSSELQTRTPLLPVLRQCPNSLMNTGENRELYVPNSHLRTSPRRIQMAEFLGKLAGVAVRTKTPLDLNLPPVVWKLLVGQNVARHDIEAVHQGCFQVVDTIANLDAHGITEAMFDEIVDASFTVLSSTRETVELLPGGSHLHVTWEDREEYASAVETYRLTEFAPVCGDISRGLATILPTPTLGLFSWHELRTLVCGKASVDIALLRRRTIYGDGCQATDPHVAFFWDVLGDFSDEQKSSFLRFVWGRSRLPTHAADFTQDFKISGLPKAAGRADMYLPIAHTCFFSIDLPAYSSREVMHDKLVYAITHCQSIDADNTTVAQRAGQGINWTNAAATATASATAAVSSVIAGMASITGE